MNRFSRSHLLAAAFLPLLWAGSASAGMVTLDFEHVDFSVGAWNSSHPDGSDPPSMGNPIFNSPTHTSHGRVVTNALGLSVYGVGISADNRGGGPDLAVIFDTRRTDTRDPDLEDPFGTARNQGSNPDITNGPQRPGHVLMVQENSTGCGDGKCNLPDDEAGGPNTISFDFSQFAGGVDLWEIDIFDVDDDKHGRTLENVMLTATYTDGAPSQTIQFDGNDIGHARSATLDLSNLFMKNSRVGVLDVKFSGSGALDRLKFATPMSGGGVPEPTSFAVLLTGVIGLGIARRRRGRAGKAQAKSEL